MEGIKERLKYLAIEKAFKKSGFENMILTKESKIKQAIKYYETFKECLNQINKLEELK